MLCLLELNSTEGALLFLPAVLCVRLMRKLLIIFESNVLWLGHQGAAQNSFSPLSGLGSEEGLYFGERDDTTVVSGEKGDIWNNPIAEPVLPSHLDGVEMLQEGTEHLLIQWKHSEVNPSDFFHGEDKDGSLECSPLSKWDPNDHKELEVI